MGGATSVQKPQQDADADLNGATDKNKWKLMPSSEEARLKFEKDGTLIRNSEPGHLELRAMLDDPIAEKTLGKYAKEKKCLDIFMCWIDCQEYKSIPTDDFRRSKALTIYHKYIKPGAVLQIGGIEQHEQEAIRDKIMENKAGNMPLQSDFYEKLQVKCFLEIYHNIYIPFKSSNMYEGLTQQLRKTYNLVKVEDFDFMNKLGEGGFGFVVHCKKKSTGKHYAMKIQTKVGLVECFADDPRRADYEKQAFASCSHPFIVNLDYAFQTDTLAIMVLGLSTCGDLQRAQRREAEERLNEDRVRFYSAEIICALSYLHQMGLMYRDLKPNNVLLNGDGHIQLVDLGGVLDEEGRVLGMRSEGHGLAPLFAQRYGKIGVPEAAEEQEVDPREKKSKTRRMSIMGTFGYMAPEMVIMLSQTSAEKIGYTNAVDWWSLGVTMFKLLTGFRPFSEENFNTFVEMVPTINGRHAPNGLPEYSILFQQIPFPHFLSGDVVDLISRLLDVNDKTRLGSGPGGVKNLKEHRFFSSIDWDLLELKQLEPPFIPETKKLEESPVYADFETMMKELGKADWLTEAPKPEDQKYFNTWDFTSPHTLRVEYGIANEMEQYDRNFKVRQMMGEAAPPAVQKGKSVLK